MAFESGFKAGQKEGWQKALDAVEKWRTEKFNSWKDVEEGISKTTAYICYITLKEQIEALRKEGDEGR